MHLSQDHSGESSKRQQSTYKSLEKPLLEGPPGFPQLFPQLSQQEQQMALQYISHADEMKHLARIQRVKQSIMEKQNEPQKKFPKITHEVDKGTWHVFDFKEDCERLKRRSLYGKNPLASTSDHDLHSSNEGEPEHSFSSPFNAAGSEVFKMGSFSKNSSSSHLPAVKRGRNRPPAWKR